MPCACHAAHPCTSALRPPAILQPGRPCAKERCAATPHSRSAAARTSLATGQQKQASATTHLRSPNGLVHHDACVGQAPALAWRACCQQQGGHGGCLANTERADWAGDVLHAVWSRARGWCLTEAVCKLWQTTGEHAQLLMADGQLKSVDDREMPTHTAPGCVLEWLGKDGICQQMLERGCKQYRLVCLVCLVLFCSAWRPPAWCRRWRGPLSPRRQGS